MIKIDMSAVKEKVLECLDLALDRILKEGLTGATTLRFWMDGRFGSCGVSLNEDDDETYRLPEPAACTRPNVCGVWIEAIGNLDDRYDEARDSDEPVLVTVHGTRQTRHESSEAFWKFLSDATVKWVMDWYKSKCRTHWKPCWILVEENNIHSWEWQRITDRPLPPAGDTEKEPLSIRGLEVVAPGMKVYTLTYGPKKYADLSMPGDSPCLFLRARKLIRKVKSPIVVSSYREWLRTGGMARCDGPSFALRVDHPATPAARDFLGRSAEFLPAFDGEHHWHLVNVVELVAVLKAKTTKSASVVEVEEFDLKALQKLTGTVFKASENPAGDIYFLERPGEESFLQFCERSGLRGLEWKLIWCESTAQIEAMLDTFVQEVEARLRRLTGTANVSRRNDDECINSLHGDIWRIGRLKNRRLSAVRGYLCRYLPDALADIRRMEKHNTGHLAAYGPEV